MSLLLQTSLFRIIPLSDCHGNTNIGAFSNAAVFHRAWEYPRFLTTTFITLETGKPKYLILLYFNLGVEFFRAFKDNYRYIFYPQLVNGPPINRLWLSVDVRIASLFLM